MKKWLVIMLCLFLVACNDNNTKSAESPEKALQLLSSSMEGYPKIVRILNSIDISNKQVFYIFEGENDDHSEWFVANIEADQDANWFVNESINIGLPNSDYDDQYSGTNTFTAGFSSNSEEIKDNWKVFHIPDSEYYVWIELQ